MIKLSFLFSLLQVSIEIAFYMLDFTCETYGILLKEGYWKDFS